jgi:hypothetical protein
LLRRRQRSQGLLNACDPRLLIGVEFPGRVEFLRQRERPFEARLRLVAQLRELNQDYNQLVLPYLNYALACAPIPRQVPYAPERPYLEAKTPSAPPPGVLLWQSRGEQRSRQSKKAPAVQAGANRWCSNHL